ncbi:MAG: hypothetical protein U0163_15555 [Gemmatimonadaceae bacterium]
MPPPNAPPCFELPAEGEILVAGRKLIGSAQLRDAASLLQHGSILIHDDQPLVAAVASRHVGSVAPAATLTDALGHEPPFADVATPLIRALARHIGCEPHVFDVSAIEAQIAPLAQRYATDEWTWHR